MSNNTAVSRFLISFLIGSFLLSCAVVSLGQSGRRARKPATPAVVEPESTDKPAPPAPKPAPTLLLNVGMDHNGGFVNFPLYYYADALRTIVQRLSQNASVKVNDVGAMTRSDAVKEAKAGQEGYVVYLQLKSENMGSAGGRGSAQNAAVEYWVFAPTTAKVATSGNTYARDYQNRSILRPDTSVYDNYLLNLAAQAAAERILAHFHKPTGIKLPSPLSR